MKTCAIIIIIIIIMSYTVLLLLLLLLLCHIAPYYVDSDHILCTTTAPLHRPYGHLYIPFSGLSYQ